MKLLLLLTIFIVGLSGCDLKQRFTHQKYIWETYQHGVKIDEQCLPQSGFSWDADTVYYKNTRRKCE